MQHLNVEVGALAQARGLQQLALGVQDRQTFGQLFFDGHDRGVEALLCRDPVLGGIDVEPRTLAQDLAGQRIDLDHTLDLVAEELDPHGEILV